MRSRGFRGSAQDPNPLARIPIARRAWRTTPRKAGSDPSTWGFERVELHADLTMLARLSQALAGARAAPLAA